jgi:hypothetical protein
MPETVLAAGVWVCDDAESLGAFFKCASSALRALIWSTISAWFWLVAPTFVLSASSKTSIFAALLP